MKVIYTPNTKGITRSHRAEKHFVRSIKPMAIYKNDLIPIIDLRIYETPRMSYCCIWVVYTLKGSAKHNAMRESSGSGKNSNTIVAINKALNDTGIKFKMGTSTVHAHDYKDVYDRLKAFGKSLGYKNLHIINGIG